MQKVNYKKLNRSIKMYPIFYGLTADLIFWIAINTLFLTTVKHLSASDINSLGAIGFFIYLLIRDPFDNYMKKTLFEHSSELVHDKIINYLNLARKVFSLIYSSMVALILLKLNYVYVMSLLLIISIMFMLLIIKINNLVIRGEKNELHT